VAPISTPSGDVRRQGEPEQGKQGISSVRLVLVDDRSSIGDYMSSPDGERVIVENVRRNRTSIKRVLE
jgi:hypothetical protein